VAYPHGFALEGCGQYLGGFAAGLAADSFGLLFIDFIRHNRPAWQAHDRLGFGDFALHFCRRGACVGFVFLALCRTAFANGFCGDWRAAFGSRRDFAGGAFGYFFSVVLPLARHGFITAAVLGFAHTVGEFGVVLMIGGNIPGKTRVVSVEIYNHVEAMEYAQAHGLAACLLAFSFVVLLLLYGLKPKQH